MDFCTAWKEASVLLTTNAKSDRNELKSHTSALCSVTGQKRHRKEKKSHTKSLIKSVPSFYILNPRLCLAQCLTLWLFKCVWRSSVSLMSSCTVFSLSFVFSCTVWRSGCGPLSKLPWLLIKYKSLFFPFYESILTFLSCELLMALWHALN